MPDPPELTAVICPSIYVEPFCGVNVEAQLCGIPVIASDHGAFTETIENIKAGLICHTIQDFRHGVEMAINREFNRIYVRERAIKKFSMYNVAKTYDYIFKSTLDIYNGSNGYLSSNNHIVKSNI